MRTNSRVTTLPALLLILALIGAACAADPPSSDEPDVAVAEGVDEPASADATQAQPAVPAAEPERTIDITMVDIGYRPAQISVADGETVLLRFTNEGQLPHDVFIGDEAAQADHEVEMSGLADEMSADEMAAMDSETESMVMDDGAAGGMTVQVGEVAEVVYTFRAGEGVLIGCHQPGHYAAGMKIQVDVA